MNFGALLKQNRLIVLMACATAATLIFISESSHFQAERSLRRLGDIAQTRTQLQDLERGLLDAEAGQRGYLLTKRPEYLRPYERALQRVAQALDALELHYRSRAAPAGSLASSAATIQIAQMAQMAQLRALSESKLSELALTIKLHDEGRTEASNEIVLSGIGRDQMEALRLLSAELAAQEIAQGLLGRAEIHRLLLADRWGVAAVSLFSLVALFIYLRQAAALQLHQRQLKQQVQAERDQLEVQVAHRTAELTELTHHLQTAREDERSRLARDLHDELGALLTSAKLDAARIKSRLASLPQDGPAVPEALARLAHLGDTLNSGITLKRRIIEDLRPSALANLGLVETLEILAREFAEQSGLKVQCDLTPVPLEPDAQLVVYRLVQEALTNISKHARASQVDITMRVTKLEATDPTRTEAGHAVGSEVGPEAGQAVEVRVQDNGVGFDSAARPAASHGLLGMRFRVQAEGGHLVLNSVLGQGTHIRMTLPVHPPHPAVAPSLKR
jgi:signal transduction histidine kinase